MPDFTPDQMKQLAHLAERIQRDAEWFGARLVVAVWDKGDTHPVAWIDVHPSDSHPHARFTATDDDEVDP